MDNGSVPSSVDHAPDDRTTPGSRRSPSAWSLAAAAYVFAVVMMGTTLPTPLYPAYEQRYAFGSLTTTVLFAVYAGGVILALVTVGQASGRWGRRPVLLIGVGLSLLSTLGFLVAGQLWILYVARVVSGLSAGIFTATGTASVIENAPRSRGALASALATAANIGGLGLGILMAGFVAQAVPWPLRTPFLVHALLLVVAGLALLGVRETVSPSRSRPLVQAPRVPREARGIFAASSVGAVAGFAMCGVYSSVAPGFMTSVLGMHGSGAIGLVVALVFVASAAAQIGFGALGDRWLIAGGALALAVGMVLMSAALLAASLPALVASAMLSGAGQGVLFMTGMRAVMARTPADERTQATTSYFVVAYLSISVPAIGAGLVSTTMSLRTTGLLCAIAIGIVALAALAAARRFPTSRS